MTSEDLLENKQFIMNAEQSIRAANQEVINPIVGHLSEGVVVEIAIEVAKRRAAYVQATLKLGQRGEHQPTGAELKELRLEYEETRDAFDAFMAAIERGYVEIPDHL
ncbi:MAG: hypothetical protein V3R37_05070 [Rhodospirillales bacterium]